MPSTSPTCHWADDASSVTGTSHCWPLYVVRLSRTKRGCAEGRLPGAAVQWPFRERRLRPPARPQRVLDPRRGVPDPRARGPRGPARDARRRAHRPRLARRLGRPLQGGGEAGDQADRRLRGLRRRRPPRPHARLRAPDAAGRVERGLREPDQALLARLPRGLLHEAARRLGAAADLLEGADRALGLPLRPRLQGARGEPARRRAHRPRPAGADLRARQHLRRAPERGPRRAAARQPASSSKLAAEAKLPLVATGDVHYLTAADAYSHEALLCIQSGDSLKNPNHWHFDTNEFYFKTPAEMALDFPGHEDAMRRTLEVAERCSIEIELGNILLPKFPTPDGRDAFEYLVELCERGLERRYDKVTPELRERLQFELKTIKRDGLRRLLPDRLGLHPLREGERDRRRPGPRLGRRLARRLLRSRSPTSTRSATTCSSSASSTRAARRCRTSTSTSPSRAASA